MPQRFMQEGYLTIGMGKIFHEGMPKSDPQDYLLSWSPEAFFPNGRGTVRAAIAQAPRSTRSDTACTTIN